MITQEQIAAAASFVAQALYAKSIEGIDSEPTWEEADADLRDQFLLMAHVAMGAHDAWLTVNSYTIVKMNRQKKRAEIKKIGLVDSLGRAMAGRA